MVERGDGQRRCWRVAGCLLGSQTCRASVVRRDREVSQWLNDAILVMMRPVCVLPRRVADHSGAVEDIVAASLANFAPQYTIGSR